ncbi:MAG: hypothetical protein M0R32_11770 [Candidatus Cloacimonetes bacterium]|jgi:hypothetical protein|nr:hypothetical protein [Candidatus Cloacimonadota bacterium]
MSFDVFKRESFECKKTRRPKYTLVKSLPTRAKARSWCRNHYFECGWKELTIKHPDGKEETYERNA